MDLHWYVFKETNSFLWLYTVETGLIYYMTDQNRNVMDWRSTPGSIEPKNEVRTYVSKIFEPVTPESILIPNKFEKTLSDPITEGWSIRNWSDVTAGISACINKRPTN